MGEDGRGRVVGEDRRGKRGGGIGESKDWSTRDGGRKTCIMLMVDENEEEDV